MILIMDFWLRSGDSLYSEKYDGALKNKEKIELLILGNSHAHYGVDPTVFSLFAYNLANVNQSIYFDKRITTSIIDSLPNLKYVLISVDYHSLYFSSQGVRDIWSYYGNGIKYKNKSYFKSDFSPFLFGYTPKVSISMLKKRLINYYKYGNKCISYDVEDGVNLLDTLNRGFLPYDVSKSLEFTEDKYKYKTNLFSKKVNTLNEKSEVLADLESFIKILISYNVEPILITPPTFIEYNRYLDSSILNQNNKDIMQLCNTYDLMYLNYMNNTLFEKDDFKNGDHLNRIGALKFGKILNDTIMSFTNRNSN